VIENYRADVLDSLGLGYEVLTTARPDIILVSMAGYGKTGPERAQVGFGPIIEQMSALTSLTGYGDDGVPTKTGLSYGDPVAGMAAVTAAVLALIKRRKTGEGTFIDLAQREVLSTFIGEAFVAASLRGETTAQRGNREARYFAQGVYRCAGDEQWIAVSMRTLGEWRSVAKALGATGGGGGGGTTTTNYTPGAVQVFAGTVIGGSASSLTTSDNVRFDLRSAASGNNRIVDYDAILTGINRGNGVTQIALTVENQMTISGSLSVYLYNYATGAYVQIGSQSVGSTDTTTTYTITSGAANYVSSSGDCIVGFYRTRRNKTYYNLRSDLVRVAVTTNN